MNTTYFFAVLIIFIFVFLSTLVNPLAIAGVFIFLSFLYNYYVSKPENKRFAIQRIGAVDKKAYLRSSAWKQKRDLVLDRDNYSCVVCGIEATEVHHQTYENLELEPLEDLVSLCRSCHQSIHDEKGYSIYQTYYVKDMKC